MKTRKPTRNCFLKATQTLMLGAFLLGSSLALAQPGRGAAAPVPSLTLQASASQEVANDEMHVVLAVERDGAQVAGLNAAVLEVLNEAVAEARKAPGVRPALGSVHTQPLWGPQGRPAGWRVRGELRLESRDFAQLSALAGRLGQRLQFAGVTFRVSEELRRRSETELLSRAAQAFHDKARITSRALGFSGYEIVEVTLVPSEAVVPVRRMVATAAELSMRSDAAPLPDAAGESTMTVVISGKVTLLRQ